MADFGQAQILEKARYDTQHIISLQAPTQNLQPSSIRARPLLLGLSANNVAYCYLGYMLKFWDVVPVPSEAAAPYDDAATYGMIPAWGFAEVLQSTIANIPKGAIISGVWSVRTTPMDLSLEQARNGPANSYIRTDPGADDLAKLHIEYVHQTDPRLDNTCVAHPSALAILGWTAVLKPVWETSYVVNRFVLSAQDEEPIHPMPRCNMPWPKSEADVSQAVLVIFAAGSKTAQSLVHELIHSRPRERQPKAVLAVTKATSLSILDHSKFPTRLVHYDAIEQPATLEWIASYCPKRVISFDYGAPLDRTALLQPALIKYLPDVPLLKIGIGTRSQVAQLDIQDWMRNVVQARCMFMCDASGQRAAVIERLGRERYLTEMNEAWNVVLTNKQLITGELELGRGIEGRDGFQGGWKRVCEGDLDPNVALAYQL